MASDFFDDPANQPAYDAQKEQAKDFLSGLEEKYGIKAGETDLTNLSGKNPEGYKEGPTDFRDFENALDQQFDLRAHNQPGGGGYEGPVDHNGNPITGGSGGGSGGRGGYNSFWNGQTYGPTFNEGAPNWIQPFTDVFSKPTTTDLENSPGYQGRMNAANRGIQNSAAARGTLLTPGTLRAMTSYDQDLASNEYNNLWNQDRSQYLDKFNIFNTNETNRFNSQSQNRAQDYGIFAGQQAFNYGAFNTDRNFNYNAMNTDRNFDYGVFNTNRNFDAGRADTQFNQGLSVWDGNRSDMDLFLRTEYEKYIAGKPSWFDG